MTNLVKLNRNFSQRVRNLGQLNQCRFFLFTIYCFSHGLVVLSPNGIWWDDWALFYNSAETIRNSFRQSGVFPPYVGDLHVFLTSLGPIAYRTLTFACFYVISILFFDIFKRITKGSFQHTLLFTILFTILPFNIARIAAIDLPYTISLTLFLTAWRIYPKNLFLSSCCFFVSYLTQSLLLFMLVVFVLELIYQIDSKITIRSAFKLSTLLFLPIFYWIVKVTYYKPYGDYEGYNQGISLINIVRPVRVTTLDLLNFRTSLLLNILLFAFTYFVLSRFRIINLKSYQRVKLASFGFFALAIGVLPYFLLGLTPTFRDWNSRHQILMPFGASLVIGSLVIGSNRIQKIALALIVSTSMSFTTVNYLSFWKDWNKQTQIIDEIRDSILVKECSVILVEDKTIDKNAMERVYRFYEWNAIIKVATGYQNKFVINAQEFNSFKLGNFDSYFREEFSAKEFERNLNNILCSAIIDYANGSYSVNIYIRD